ncbi:hypothetical protein HMPREF1316_0700 [Olsenella profusa F0195]|uniref:Uncharacterized protein n=1 Tax=Olsenella profusa F0195 TaxID=1125712 RepID=U2TIJ5_9ACTN|nr:hypothetical protein HMPREF1316_0700 [Olsenella profusa F0195]
MTRRGFAPVASIGCIGPAAVRRERHPPMGARRPHCAAALPVVGWDVGGMTPGAQGWSGTRWPPERAEVSVAGGRWRQDRWGGTVVHWQGLPRGAGAPSRPMRGVVPDRGHHSIRAPRGAREGRHHGRARGV